MYMRVKTRTTAQGTEYWDTKEKRSIFVHLGDEPGFEVNANPKSMLNVNEDEKKEDTGETAVNFNMMTVQELRKYAEELCIDIPDDVKKKADIISLLQ